MTDTAHNLIHSAIAQLASEDREKRKDAHAALESAGGAAVWALIEALSPHDERARPEIFKILGSIADPAAADVFLKGLEDESGECRWFAAEGLVALGKEGLVRILGELTDYPDSPWKLRGAHHVLNGLRYAGFNDVVDPVLRAFVSDISHIALPKAAHAALARLRR